MKAQKCLLLIVLLGLFLGQAQGVNWGKTELDQGPLAGSLVATVVDPLGRIHTAYTEDSDILNPGTLVHYRLRRSAGRDFEELSNSPLFLQSSTVLSLSLDVSSVGTVQIALTTSRGNVLLYERAADSDTWGSATVIAENASTVPAQASISLQSAGNGALRSGLVYTTDTGSARFSEQRNPGDWSAPVNVFAAENTGLAVRLINTPMGIIGDANIRRVAVAYDEAGERVIISKQTNIEIAGNLAPVWLTLEEVGAAPDATRPDIAYFNGKLGVTFTQIQNGGGVFFYSLESDNSGMGTTWRRLIVANSDEIDSDSGQFFGVHAPLAYDGNGDPLVAYQRNVLAIFVLAAVDLRTRRLVEGQGWELGMVETFSAPNNGFQRETDLAMSRHGDPALIYQRKARNDENNSTVIFARPLPQPWVLDRPDSLQGFSQVYTPALTTGLNGEIHLAVSGSSGGILTPLEFEPNRLITISGNSESIIELPPFANPYAAQALTVTPDGVIHIVSHRLETSTDESGELLYVTVTPEGTVTSMGMVDEGMSHARAGSLILKNDAAGNLYCAYLRPSGPGRLRVLTAGSESWTSLVDFFPTPLMEKLSMDIREDGAWAVSFLADDRIQVRTNVDVRNGEVTGSFFNLTYAPPSPGFPLVDTAIAFASDGRPRIVYSTTAGRLSYLTPRRVGPLGSVFTRSEIGLNFNNAILTMEGGNNLMHVMAHTPVDGGTFRYVKVKNDLESVSEAFSIPATGLTTSANRQSLVSTLDQNGFPVMAAGLIRNPLLFSSNQVVLCRPADAMDRDGDGIPVLLEDAYCLNDAFPNSKDQLARLKTRRSALGVELSFEYRRVDNFGGNILNGRRYGDFLYTIEHSGDLINWDAEEQSETVFPLLNSDLGTDEGANCLRSLQGFLYTSGELENTPKRFTRLLIERDR